MRVTQAMLTRNSLQRVMENRSNMAKTNERIVSGKKFSRSSDDPISFSKSERLKTNLTQNEQFLDKIKYAESWIGNTVSLMENLNDLALKARDIAHTGSDGSSNEEIRGVLAGQLEAVLNEALAVTNSDYLDKSVFSGTATNVEDPFLYQAGVVSYTGNADKMNRTYSESVSVDINVSGQQIMDTGMFEAMTNLLTALNANDETAIRAEIDTLKSAADQLNAITAEVGAQSKNISYIKLRLEQSNLDLQKFLSEEEDIKLDEEIVRLKAEELSYQAAMQSTSRMLELSILNYF